MHGASVTLLLLKEPKKARDFFYTIARMHPNFLVRFQPVSINVTMTYERFNLKKTQLFFVELAICLRQYGHSQRKNIIAFPIIRCIHAACAVTRRPMQE